jgi:hypothetical protein
MQLHSQGADPFDPGVVAVGEHHRLRTLDVHFKKVDPVPARLPEQIANAKSWESFRLARRAFANLSGPLFTAPVPRRGHRQVSRMRPDCATYRANSTSIGGHVIDEDFIIACVRLNGNDLRLGGPAQQIGGAVAHIGPTVHDKPWSLDVIEASVFPLEEDLSKDGEIARPRTGQEQVPGVPGCQLDQPRPVASDKAIQFFRPNFANVAA